VTTILYFGKSDRRIESWARAHARWLGERGRIIFLAPYGEDFIDGNFEFINCFRVQNPESIDTIQARLGVSVNRALACDRSLTDYSHSTSHGAYSRYTPAEIQRLVEAVATGISRVIDRVDFCVDGLYDNFITPLAFEIARSQGVNFYMLRIWHFWHDRFSIVDSPGYVSSRVNALYARYRRRLTPAAVPRVLRELNEAKFRIGAFAHENLQLRLRIVRDKMRSYERPAFRNLLRRRLSRLIGPWKARNLRYRGQADRPAHYIVYALHVMPEASILGTDPELADQFSLIRRLSINIPAGVEILCKAHPGDRFGRDLEIGFLQRLCSLHNVSLVPETENIGSFFADPRCLAVATINGSVAIEGVMAGKPAFLFGKGIFAIADCFLKPRTDQEFFDQVMLVKAGNYKVDQCSLAAIMLAIKRDTVQGGRSLREPGSWLEYYSAMFPAFHRYHERNLGRGQK
jgi:hypothetical protein